MSAPATDRLNSLPLVFRQTPPQHLGPCSPCFQAFYRSTAEAVLSYRPKMPVFEAGRMRLKTSDKVWQVPCCWSCLESEAARAYDLGAVDLIVSVPAEEEERSAA